MKWFYESILKLSMWAAEKLYNDQVSQVDVWFEGGRKVCIMTAEEQEKLIRVSKNLQDNWTDAEREELRKAIQRIREDEISG